MELLPIAIVLSIGLTIGFGALFVLLRRSATTQGLASHEQAVSAAVAAALAERGATAEAMGRDREATVQAAVARAAEVADAKLDARLRSGTEKLEANMALGHQKYDASASIIEKQNNEMRLELKRVEKMLTEKEADLLEI